MSPLSYLLLPSYCVSGSTPGTGNPESSRAGRKLTQTQFLILWKWLSRFALWSKGRGDGIDWLLLYCEGREKRKVRISIHSTMTFDPEDKIRYCPCLLSLEVCVINLKGVVWFQKKSLYLKIASFPLPPWNGLKFHHYNSLVWIKF